MDITAYWPSDYQMSRARLRTGCNQPVILVNVIQSRVQASCPCSFCWDGLGAFLIRLAALTYALVVSDCAISNIKMTFKVLNFTFML
eukprot:4040950-Pleurochrysis_carterae.AAC.2